MLAAMPRRDATTGMLGEGSGGIGMTNFSSDEWGSLGFGVLVDVQLMPLQNHSFADKKALENRVQFDFWGYPALPIAGPQIDQCHRVESILYHRV